MPGPFDARYDRQVPRRIHCARRTSVVGEGATATANVKLRNPDWVRLADIFEKVVDYASCEPSPDGQVCLL